VDTRKMLDRKASALMVGLCMIWGLQQVVLKLAAADISPMMQIAIRSGLSAILVYPLIQRQKGTTLWSKQYLFPGMWVAFLFSAEFFLVAEALRYTSASHTVVLLYTAPIFVALGLHWKLPAERLSMLQWVGISIAFLGIVVTFLGREEVHSTLFGDFLALLAGLLWALTTISLRLTQLSDAHPTQTLFYQLVGGCVLLLPLAFLMGQAEIYWTGLAIGSLIFHTIVVSFISFMLWFWLLRNYLANRLGVFSFLTPIFGMLFGVLFLNEQIELNFLFGAAMVMLGVMIVSLHHWIEKKLYSQVKTNEWSE
jgi:drug/metabolite transporter (DMT)-like permease